MLEPAPADDLAPLEEPVEEAPQAAPDDETPAPEAQAAPVEDAAEAQPDRMVPLGTLKQLEGKLRDALKQAERAQELEQQVNQFKPYADFLAAHPHLLQPPQAPAQPTTPQADTEALRYAEKLQLYTRDGQLDAGKAREILNDHDAAAQRAAERVMQPVSTQLAETKAAQNVQSLLQMKDADGRPLEESYIRQTVGAITQGMPREKALQVLADPSVVQVIGMTALGMQAAQKKSAPKPPEADPLFRESAGGGPGFVMSEDERRFARTAKLSEKTYAERAKGYKPGQALEME